MFVDLVAIRRSCSAYSLDVGQVFVRSSVDVRQKFSRCLLDVAETLDRGCLNLGQILIVDAIPPVVQFQGPVETWGFQEPFLQFRTGTEEPVPARTTVRAYAALETGRARGHNISG